MIKHPIFISMSGSHLYGIPDPSDTDLRGCHVLAPGLDNKVINLLRKPNVNMIEAALSPLVITSSDAHLDLKVMALECLSKDCYGHLQGFIKHTKHHAEKENYEKPKRNLYLLKSYYQGIYLFDNLTFRSSFEYFKDLYCYNDDIMEELFYAKIHKEGFGNKNVLQEHIAYLDRQLQKSKEATKLREHPAIDKEEAIRFYRGVIKELL